MERIGPGRRDSRREAANLSALRWLECAPALGLLVALLDRRGAGYGARACSGPSRNEDQFLPVDEAFVFSAIAEATAPDRVAARLAASRRATTSTATS